MAKPMELYEVFEGLERGPTTNKFLELLNVYYVTLRKEPMFGRTVPQTPLITVRRSDGSGRGTVEFWPSEGPVCDVAYGNSSRLEELLRKGVLKLRSSFTYDPHYDQPMVSFQVAEDQERKLRKYGLNKLFMGLENINIYLEPMKRK